MDFVKFIISILVGWLIGRERKQRTDNSAGSRTLAIISLASCIIAVLTLKIVDMSPESFDFSRLMAYGIASIGFLGSSIIVQHGKSVDGTTTAASIWAIVPINYMIGLGYYSCGIGCAILLYLILDSKYWDFNAFNEKEK
jgi:putative Mg2+ transporter-C (MgtC) family protein